MHTDPIADLLTRIRNAANAGHEDLVVPYSRTKEDIIKVMVAKKFLEGYEIVEDKHKNLKIQLKDDRKDMTLRRVSTPGQRIYVKKEELKPVRSGLGITIISTSKGVMTNYEAKKMNLGGEIICEIY